MKTFCDKEMEISVTTIDGQTFFEKAEVRCGWHNGEEKYQCKDCQLLDNK